MAQDNFKLAIKAYLDNRASTDELFKVTYAKENKNIDDCCTYIVNEVRKSTRQGYADDEVFGMAVHYYDEDNIEVGKPVNNVRVVTNTKIEAPAPAQAKPKATTTPRHEVKRQANEKKQAQPAPVVPIKPIKPTYVQPTLF